MNSEWLALLALALPSPDGDAIADANAPLPRMALRQPLVQPLRKGKCE